MYSASFTPALFCRSTVGATQVRFPTACTCGWVGIVGCGPVLVTLYSYLVLLLFYSSRTLFYSSRTLLLFYSSRFLDNIRDSNHPHTVQCDLVGSFILSRSVTVDIIRRTQPVGLWPGRTPHTAKHRARSSSRNDARAVHHGLVTPSSGHSKRGRPFCRPTTGQGQVQLGQ